MEAVFRIQGPTSLARVTIVQKLDDAWATGQRESRGIWPVVKMHVVLRESRIQIQDQSFFDLTP